MNNYNIYPKQFRSLRIPIEKNRCFILMPFSQSFDIIYGNIKKVLTDNGYVCTRADEILGSKPIMNTILNEILKSQFIIADLTNQNPNVFYELGVAHTFKDAQNIVLITQKIEDIPFDIRHINNIVYDPANIKYLTSSIVSTLKDSKYLMGFYEALQQRNIISIIHDNQEEFVEFLQTSLGSLLAVASDILLAQVADIKEEEIESYFSKLIELSNQAIREGNISFLSGILKVLSESIITCSQYSVTDKIAYDFLYGSLFSTGKLSQADLLSYQTDFAVSLASARIKINTVMSWIVEYFSRSKSASIDLNRYKLERFLMIHNDKVIDAIVIDALFNKNCYIREHLADIVGEKRLYEAEDSLIGQLLIEDNYFTMVSLISALGKLESLVAANHIIQTIANHIENLLKTNQLFVLKHSHIALAKIDKRHNTQFLPDFNAKYGEYIKHYFIL